MTTTASSTHCSKNDPADPRDAKRRVFLSTAAAILVASTCGATPASAQLSPHGATVTQMRLERGDDGIYLAAAVDFELPTLVQDVLDKGIAIHFVAEAELFRQRWYWSDRRMAQVSRYMRVAYQPLTRRWRLNVAPVPIAGNAGFGVSLNQNFDTLDEALDAVKRIGRMRLGDATEISDEVVHPVVFRFRLDTTQLPRPFQIGVVGLSDWDIAAERVARLAVEHAR